MECLVLYFHLGMEDIATRPDNINVLKARIGMEVNNLSKENI